MDETRAITFERPIRAVLFDKDGTIIDSLNPWAEALRLVCRAIVWRAKAPYIKHASEIVDQALASVGVKRGYVDDRGLLATSNSQTILAAIRHSLAGALDHTLIDSDLHETLEDDQRFKVFVEGILASKYPDGIPPCQTIEGANELLRLLYENEIPLGLATADSEATTLKQLDEFGWRKYFSFLSFGDTALRLKPDPWAVFEFEKVVGIPAGEIAVVGDTDVDYKMACAARVGIFVRVIESLAGVGPILFSKITAAGDGGKIHRFSLNPPTM